MEPPHNTRLFLAKAQFGHRTHMQLWFTLSDPTMEEAVFAEPLNCEFPKLPEFTRLPDESTILRFGKTPSPRHRLEKHKLAEQVLGVVNGILSRRGQLLNTGTVVDASLMTTGWPLPDSEAGCSARP